MVTVGLERFCREPGRWVRPGERVGLLLNTASVDREFRWARDRVAALPGVRLRALFGPQHGVRSDVQDNMVESPHGVDPVLGIPVWSLYAERREPTAEMLDGLDVLLVDLWDVGCRVYTFIWTLRLAMAACGRAGVRVVVLDRPNPLGRAAEGNLLEPEQRSFVGLEPIPMRHGLTVGELARWFRCARGVECELDVVPVEGWDPGGLWPEVGRPWIMPSPNMPTFDTALVYPGTVLLEGTTASEGRGTTRPFEIVGGPWVGGEALARRLERYGLPGVVFRPVGFEPTFQKWAGRPCEGVHLHVTDPAAFRPYRTGLAILAALWDLASDRGFGWRPPPYEYETERLPIHLLLGSERLREAIEAGADPREMESGWAEDLRRWEEETAMVRLY
ncbi:exo-beta-N-acetylmuramidase NamZ family protein [Deferrisoma sp.]